MRSYHKLPSALGGVTQKPSPDLIHHHHKDHCYTLTDNHLAAPLIAEVSIVQTAQQINVGRSFRAVSAVIIERPTSHDDVVFSPPPSSTLGRVMQKPLPDPPPRTLAVTVTVTVTRITDNHLAASPIAEVSIVRTAIIRRKLNYRAEQYV